MRKQSFTTVLLFFVIAYSFSSCHKAPADTAQGLSEDIIFKIKNLGFDPSEAYAHEGGYIVENDIFITKENLEEGFLSNKILRAGAAEQYRTTNLVTGLPRTVSVSISSDLPSSYAKSLDEAIRRFNAENLDLKFTRVSSGAQISITKAPSGLYLAIAGFPTNAGEPFNSIKMNTSMIGVSSSTTFMNYVATIIAHEIGHCIGFRHTDYMNRAFSCGGSASNEGASTVGAIHIPGTPTTADSGSWMLACTLRGQTRHFNNNDKTALNYLY